MAKTTALAHGAIDGDHVVVADVAQANRLHNKSQAGTPQAGNKLRLSLTEAAYCVASGWLEVAGGANGKASAANGTALTAADLVAHAADQRRALTDHLVYRDLRERGLVARHAPGTSHFDVWPRGTAMGPVLFQNVAVSVHDPVRTSDLLDGAPNGIVCSVLDEDSAITHYRIETAEPKGKVPTGHLPKALGRRVADRVQVTDPAAVAAYAKEFLGTAADGAVFLSPLETEGLVRRGLLAIPGHASAPKVPSEVLQTYEALRAAGVVAKSGFRFGAHLRGYVGAPDDSHADWLVHCAKPSEGLAWSDLSRGVRLAHGVRKQFLVSIPEGTTMRFVRISWTKV